MEYREDLDNYYQSGYGYDHNAQPMCAAMADMLKHMESKEKYPQMVAYFGHASGVQMLLNSLRAVKDDEPLRADNYKQQFQRRWAISKISPFATNIVAIKYDCLNTLEHEKVVFYLNERPLQFDWCQRGLCDLSMVKNQYKYYRNANCSKAFCSETEKNSGIKLFHFSVKIIVISLLAVPLIKNI